MFVKHLSNIFAPLYEMHIYMHIYVYIKIHMSKYKCIEYIYITFYMRVQIYLLVVFRTCKYHLICIKQIQEDTRRHTHIYIYIITES